jgi:hypothetical protein
MEPNKVNINADQSRLIANVLMIVLVFMNIFFSIQYYGQIKRENELYGKEESRITQEAQKTNERIQTGRFIKLFVDKVLGTNGVIAFEDRVKLEADIRAFEDGELLSMWESFVSSQTSEEAQQTAVKLMSALSNRMI